MKIPRPAFLLLSVLLWGCNPNRPQPALGSVFQVVGAVSISDVAPDSKARVLTAGDKFPAGSTIHLRSGSEAVLCLTPGIYVRCFGENELHIEQMSILKDGDETGNAMVIRQAAVRLEKGRAHIFLPAAGSSRATLKINARSGVLSAKAGSLFSVSLEADSTRVLSARGEVNWTEPPAHSADIPAGYFSDYKNGADSAGIATPAADDPTAQREIMELLDSAQLIADLEETVRNAPAPWRK